MEKTLYQTAASHYIKNTINEQTKNAAASQKEKIDMLSASGAVATVSSSSVPSLGDLPIVSQSQSSAFSDPMEALLAAAQIHQQSKNLQFFESEISECAKMSI